MSTTKKQAHIHQAIAEQAAKVAARNAGPEPLEVTPEDPNAAFLQLLNEYNAAEMESHRLLGEVVKATLKRRGDRLRIGEGGQLLHQTIGNVNDWSAGRKPRILIIESLGE